MSDNLRLKDQLQMAVEIANFLNYMENIQSCSPLTRKAYLLDLTQAFGEYLNPENRNQRVSETTLTVAARAALLRWGNLSLSSRNRKSATLKSFFGYLFQESKIERDFASQIRSPKIPKKIPHFISVDEALAVLQSFETDPDPNPDEKLLFLLLYGCGLRVSEACRLEWKNIDLNQKILRIIGKGGKERLVAAPKPVIDILIRRSRISASVWAGMELSSRKAYEWIRRRGQKAGLLRPIHPHALRHSFATHLLSSGANLRTLQELLGHESLQATEKYTHLGVDQLARTLDSHHPLGIRTRK
jgi:site-specific recombinase XerD